MVNGKFTTLFLFHPPQKEQIQNRKFEFLIVIVGPILQGSGNAPITNSPVAFPFFYFPKSGDKGEEVWLLNFMDKSLMLVREANNSAL